VVTVPPFVPVTVKITVVPEHTLVEEELIATLGETLLLTVKVMPDEVADVELKQDGKLPPDVWTALTTSPFVGM
jgi:hypothetical protein